MLNENEIRELLDSPLSLLKIRDEEEKKQINMLLPYSTGFEIECWDGKAHQIQAFKSIPYLIDCDTGKTQSEHRFRVPNGIRGIITLWQLSRQLNRNLELNPESGIHYHVDCTGSYKQVRDYILKDDVKGWVLKELSEWKYPGSYNTKGIGDGFYWVRTNQDTFQTMEFRIGEMTFDYNLLLKRIFHCNSIIHRIKENLGVTPPTFEDVDIKTILIHEKFAIVECTPLQARLEELNRKLREIQIEEEKRNITDPLALIKNEVRQRLHKINTDFDGEE